MNCQWAELFRFLSRRNDRHTGKSPGSEYSGIGIRSYRNVPIKSKVCSAVKETMGNFWQRAERRFHTVQVKNLRISSLIFHARRERPRAYQKTRMHTAALHK